MMRRAGKLLWIGAIALFLAGVVSYVSLTLYYRERFVSGTWINGIYCTGLTPEEVETRLLEGTEPYTLTIHLENQDMETIEEKEILYYKDYHTKIQSIKEKQKAFLWPLSFMNPLTYEIEPRPVYDKEALERAVLGLNCMNRKKPEGEVYAKIEKGQDGYVLVEEERNQISEEKIKARVKEAVEGEERDIYIVEEDVYEEYFINEQTQKVYDAFAKIHAFQNASTVYEGLKEEEGITKERIAQWIVFLEEEPYIDEEKVDDYVEYLGDKYDTLGKDRVWNKSGGGTVTIHGGTYGFLIDREAEKKAIIETLQSGKPVTRAMIFKESKLKRPEGEEDIGKTYIEIDMSRQTLYYYVEGDLYLESPIVTGNLKRGRGTPARVCYIYGKQRRRILRGPGYASFVNYWMPVNGNIGLHDATWRKEFGGEIYKTSGSHGCINLPYEKAEKIFEKAEVGLPVIMYY